MTARVREVLIVALLVSAASSLTLADDFSVQADPRANFSKFKTFAMRNHKISNKRPELDNPLFAKILGRAIRDAMVAQGFKEQADKPDLAVDFTVSGEEISTTQRGIGAGPVPVQYSIGTLFIEATRPGETAPVWRAIYKDDENVGSKLVAKLPEDAKKLIEKFPRK